MHGDAEAAGSFSSALRFLRTKCEMLLAGFEDEGDVELPLEPAPLGPAPFEQLPSATFDFIPSIIALKNQNTKQH